MIEGDKRIKAYKIFGVEFWTRITLTENYNFDRGFVWVWNLVADTEGGTQAEGVWE
jgi:hypothetical protein